MSWNPKYRQKSEGSLYNDYIGLYFFSPKSRPLTHGLKWHSLYEKSRILIGSHSYWNWYIFQVTITSTFMLERQHKNQTSFLYCLKPIMGYTRLSVFLWNKWHIRILSANLLMIRSLFLINKASTKSNLLAVKTIFSLVANCLAKSNSNRGSIFPILVCCKMAMY